LRAEIKTIFALVAIWLWRKDLARLIVDQMKRMVLAASVSLGVLFLLTHCATESDDPFPVHPAVNENTEAVPGAATPVPAKGSSGWHW